MDTIKVEINDKEYNLLLAKTEEEKENGLKDVEEMDSSEGMFFDYRDDPQDEVSFWMQDTTMPLDIIFVGKNDTVISVHKGIPLTEDLMTEKNVYYVIELNEDSGVKSGDEVEILDESDLQDLPTSKLLVLNDDGTVQFDLGSGSNRIFSRISSRVIIHKAKKAASSKSDTDYKALGRYIFKELDRQDNRDPEYVEK